MTVTVNAYWDLSSVAKFYCELGSGGNGGNIHLIKTKYNISWTIAMESRLNLSLGGRMRVTPFVAGFHAKYLAVALLGLFSLLVTACGSSDGVPEPGETTSSNTNGGPGTGSSLSRIYQVDVGSDILLSIANIEGLDSLANSGQSLTVDWRIVSPMINSAQPEATISSNSQSNSASFTAYVVGDFVIRVSAEPVGDTAAMVARNIGIRVKLLADASIKPTRHINSSDLCFNCHSPLSWTLPRVDHQQVLGACSTCHDGKIARGVGPNHISTSKECDVCHVSAQWFGGPFPDSHPISNCIACHNNFAANGKSLLHISSTDICEACHNNNAWIPVDKVDHTQVLGSCDSCHDGYVAAGKSPVHMPTSNACEKCHGVPPQTWGPLISIDHTQTLNVLCSDCHDGFVALGKLSTHIVTQDDCDMCHLVTTWKTTSQPPI